ncbi:Cellulose synthase [Corchorus olitorius]|uniref:Cellulose synthase n=1 Tax=Corchorus olitorius TaxID=93759 RepID=A0A1R3HCC6_9ROSI|nr:Cellulose synthase [Corchorus olitorius]
MTDSNPNLYTNAAVVSNIQPHRCDMPVSHSFLLPNLITQANTSMASNPLPRLPSNDELPALDVLVCTADPDKEPTVGVMTIVILAMALDYPPEKLHVYLSDDGGFDIDLQGMMEAWKFARAWLPICRRSDIETSCPEVYFSGYEDYDHGNSDNSYEFKAARQEIKVLSWDKDGGYAELAILLSSCLLCLASISLLIVPEMLF